MSRQKLFSLFLVPLFSFTMTAAETARAGPTVTPTATPTTTPTATPTATPTSLPCILPCINGCLCVPIQVVPQGNLVALKNVGTGGKGSKLTRTVTVKMEAQEIAPGSCPFGETSAPTSVTLHIQDDDGDIVIDRTKNSFICNSGQLTHMKFGVRYEGPENCADSVAPNKVSKGDLFVTASTADGSHSDTLRIQCKK